MLSLWAGGHVGLWHMLQSWPTASGRHKTQRLSDSIAGLRPVDGGSPVLSWCRAAVGEGEHTSMPAPGDSFGAGESQVTQKNWNSATYSAQLNEIQFVKLLFFFCIYKFWKTSAVKLFKNRIVKVLWRTSKHNSQQLSEQTQHLSARTGHGPSRCWFLEIARSMWLCSRTFILIIPLCAQVIGKLWW